MRVDIVVVLRDRPIDPLIEDSGSHNHLLHLILQHDNDYRQKEQLNRCHDDRSPSEEGVRNHFVTELILVRKKDDSEPRIAMMIAGLVFLQSIGPSCGRTLITDVATPVRAVRILRRKTGSDHLETALTATTGAEPVPPVGGAAGTVIMVPSGTLAVSPIGVALRRSAGGSSGPLIG